MKPPTGPAIMTPRSQNEVIAPTAAPGRSASVRCRVIATVAGYINATPIPATAAPISARPWVLARARMSNPVASTTVQHAATRAPP